jgi:heme exporter protein C
MGTGSKLTRVLGGLAVPGVVATAVLGLTLPQSREQHAYSRLIAIHPPLAWVALWVSLTVTAVASALYLWPRTRARKWDQIAAASAEVGAVFLALTLVTGSIWGRPTWGVYWVWDARLTLTAILLALDLGYLALRRVASDPRARATRAAILGIVMPVLAVIDHFAVDWWRTLHQDSSVERIKENLDAPFIVAMLVGFVTFTLFYVWLLVHRYRLEQLEERLDAGGLELALAERRAEAVPS